VAKPEWGRKHLCGSCGTKFYDLRRTPAICPSCGAQAEAEPAGRGARKARGGAAKAAAVPHKAEAEVEAIAYPEGEAEEGADYEAPEEDSDAEEEDYGEAIEDASELAEDPDLAEVVTEEDEDT